MKTRLKTKALARVAGAALLLSAAFAAWGVNITLDDGTTALTCAATSGATINGSGDIHASVTSGCIPTGGGGGGGTGPFTLTVTKPGNGAGTVTGTGFSCGTDCTESYPDGTVISVTLTATADAGSTFTGWSGAGCTGTGTCTVATAITSNLSVAANFTADTPPPGACGTLPANTVVIDTGNITSAWPQMTNIVPPQQITAFKVTVPSGFTGRDLFNFAKTGSGLKSKLVVVSTCPGVLTPVTTTGCSLAGTDTTTVRLSGKSTDPSYYCKLTPGVYYANAVSKNALTDGTYNCSTTTNCSFYASRNPPY